MDKEFLAWIGGWVRFAMNLSSSAASIDWSQNPEIRHVFDLEYCHQQYKIVKLERAVPPLPPWQ